jgi:hypothetical protein
MTDFLSYLEALGAHFLALMSCAAFTLLGVYILARHKDRVWELRATGLLSLLCFFFASYQAWGDEHRTLTELQRKLQSPDFEGVILENMSGTRNGRETLIALGGQIVNRSGPPSGAVNFRMSIVIDGERVYGHEPPYPGKDVHLGDTSGRVVTHKHDTSKEESPSGATLPIANLWPVSMSKPIQAGEVVNGWYWCVFPGLIQEKLVSQHVKATVEFQDVVTGKVHSMMAGF